MVFVGAALCMLGAAIFLGLVFSSGGIAKSQQFRVLGELSRGQHGRTKKLLLGVALVLGCFGGCTAMIGASQRDAAVRKACETKCKSDGFEQGKLGPSTERDPQKPNRHKFVACICSGGKDTLEFDSSKLKP